MAPSSLGKREIEVELKRRRATKRWTAFRVWPNLYVHPRSTTSTQWVARVKLGGVTRPIHIGPYHLYSLDEARAEAAQLVRAVREGRDPIAEKRRAAGVPTFREASLRAHTELRRGWSNGKHADQWVSTVQAYAWPEIGDLRVDSITPADVQRTLSPIWIAKPETARRLRQRISKILQWAEVAGFRDGPNPVDKVRNGVGLARQTDETAHFKAIDWRELPAFMSDLAARQAMSAHCARFIILTTARSGEARGALWSEIDLAAKVWTLPAERKKEKRELRVPLSEPAVEILEAVAPAAQNGLVFPSANGKPLSDMVFKALFRRLARPELTIHGMRSAFSTWRAETDAAPREIAEMCLGHLVGNEVERAYQRSDVFERRRRLLQTWSDYLEANE